MRLLRATKPAHVDLMASRILTDGSVPRDAIAAELKAWLIQSPDDILIIQAWDGPSLCGFLVCVAEPGKLHAWLWQAWVDTAVPPEVATSAFSHTCAWARERGRRQIRAETWRNAEALQRRWGFRPLHTIVGIDLTDSGGKAADAV